MAKILIIDDNSAIRSTLKKNLEECGHQVQDTADSLEAEALIFNSSLDLVIADIAMPDTTGVELLKRTRFANPNTRFMLMTTFEKPLNIPVCLENNVSCYVKKPQYMAQIKDAVHNVLNQKPPEEKKLFRENKDGWLEIEANSSEKSLLNMNHYIKRYLLDRIPKKQAERISFSFYEMLRNAMEWGNFLHEEKIVTVGCIVMSNKVLLKIQDEGKGFNVAEALNPESDPVTRQKIREDSGKRPGGFGIEITRKIMDHVFYNEKGNCLIMSKNIEPDP